MPFAQNGIYNSNNSNSTTNNNSLSDHLLNTQSHEQPQQQSSENDDGTSSVSETQENGDERIADANDADDDDDVSWLKKDMKAMTAETPSRPEGINPLGLNIIEMPGRGRGVFAPGNLPAGTVLEHSPVLILTKDQWDQGKMNDTILGEYAFTWSNGGMALGLGLASMFNHSSTPNVNFTCDHAKGTITFRTFRPVTAGEELCICYAADESKLWFTPVPTSSEQSNSIPSRTSDQSTVSAETNGIEDIPNCRATEVDALVETFSPINIDDLVDPESHAVRQAKREDRRMRREKEREAMQKSSREARVAKYQQKVDGNVGRPLESWQAQNGVQAVEMTIHSPQPVPFSQSPLPPLPSTTFERDDLGSLPPPLHSTPAPSPNTPPDLGDTDELELTPDIEWDEADWQTPREDQPELAELERMLGLDERQEVEDDQGTSE